MTPLKVFGDRVVLKPVAEEFTGSVVVRPASRNLNFMLGEIVALSKNASAVFSPGNICLFQVPIDLRTNKPQCPTVKIGDVEHLVQHYKDLLATLKGPAISLDNVQIAGDWCLVKAEVIRPASGLFLPDSVTDNQELLSYKLVQKGSTTDLDLNPGDNVILEKSKAGSLEIGTERYCYVHKNFVYGVTCA